MRKKEKIMKKELSEKMSTLKGSSSMNSAGNGLFFCCHLSFDSSRCAELFSFETSKNSCILPSYSFVNNVYT